MEIKMSIEEKRTQAYYKHYILLFIQEQFKDYTLGKIVYKDFKLNSNNNHSYPRCYFRIYNKYNKVSFTIYYSEVLKYLEYRKEFLEVRDFIIKSNHSTVTSNNIYEFRHCITGDISKTIINNINLILIKLRKQQKVCK